jgi:hypothetical protein
LISHQEYARISHALPTLQRANLQLLREFLQAAFFARIQAGKVEFYEGDRANAILS